MDLREAEAVNGVNRGPVNRGSRQGVASQSFKSGKPGSRTSGSSRSIEKLTCTMATKMTDAEGEQVRAYAAAQGYEEVSSFIRATLRAATEGKSLRSPAVMHLEIFVHTVEAWIEAGGQLTVEKFREICGMVVAKTTAPAGSIKRNGNPGDA